MQSNTVETKKNEVLISQMFLWAKKAVRPIRSLSGMDITSVVMDSSSLETSLSSTSGFPITFTGGSASMQARRHRGKVLRIGRRTCWSTFPGRRKHPSTAMLAGRTSWQRSTR
jgi:hypothetical protein